MSQTTYLQFFVKSLSLLKLWPQENTYYTTIKQYYITIIITITTAPIIADLMAQFYESDTVFSRVNENLVALSALFAVIYVSLCFIAQKSEIVALAADLKKFEKYSPTDLIVETDKSVKFYTKLFIVYGIMGNVSYGLLPILTYHDCQNNKPQHMVKFGIPCGLVVRFLLPFRTDYSPLFELTAVYEIFICILGSTVIIVISMLICGVLIHISAQLKYLREFILDLSLVQDTRILEKKMKFCVKFHTDIVDYATRADVSFGQMMLLHITWTGFIISVLGFEITATSNFVEAFRFFMHLLGWLGMLFLVCYYGQRIMDESLSIAEAIYCFSWYNKEVLIQKYILLMLLRSQKPLTLRASGLKVMSLATFLEVLYSAYSYFTLLLKLN